MELKIIIELSKEELVLLRSTVSNTIDRYIRTGRELELINKLANLNEDLHKILFK